MSKSDIIISIIVVIIMTIIIVFLHREPRCLNCPLLIEMTMIMEFYHRWKDTVNKRLLKFTKNSVCLLCLFWAVSWCRGNHGSYNFARTNFKDFSRIFPRQITVFKDYDLFNKPEFLTLFPVLKPYWLKHVME